MEEVIMTINTDLKKKVPKIVSYIMWIKWFLKETIVQYFPCISSHIISNSLHKPIFSHECLFWRESSLMYKCIQQDTSLSMLVVSRDYRGIRSWEHSQRCERSLWHGFPSCHRTLVLTRVLPLWFLSLQIYTLT